MEGGAESIAESEGEKYALQSEASENENAKERIETGWIDVIVVS